MMSEIKQKKDKKQKINHEKSKLKFIELINLIKNNPTKNIGLCEDYWDKDTFKMNHDTFFQNFNKISPCPFDSQVIHGTTITPKDCGCHYRCEVSYFRNSPEIKKIYLDKYLKNLEQDYYYNTNSYNSNKQASLLTPIEEDKVEEINLKIEKELEEKIEKENRLRVKTYNDLDKNVITIHGSDKDTIPKELLDDISNIISNHFNFIHFDSSFDDNLSIYNEEISVINKECNLNNCSVSLSLYWDYLDNCKKFAFSIDTYPLEYNTLVADETTESFYDRWKTFKLINKDKYNERYKKTLHAQELEYLSFISNLECELCIFSHQCNGLFCLKSNEE